MEKISKLTTIVNAFTGELPVNEPWYKERLSICNTCEYNSDNTNGNSIFKDLLCSNKPHCTACGCCIDKKAAMKEETCGLVEKGLKPKWENLAIITKGTDWDIYNESPKIAKLEFDKEKFILNYGKLGSITKVVVILESKDNVINSVDVSCGCTKPEIYNLTPGNYKLEISLDKSRINTGIFSKNVYVSYIGKNGKEVLKINLKGTK